MSTTELEEVFALAQRVLPDPTGFAERLVQQALVWWAENSGSPGTDDGAASAWDDARTIDAAAYSVGDGLAESNTLLAAALGACECWGAQQDCPRCVGEGSSGWLDPDADLFHMFVGPAVARLSASYTDDEPIATATAGRHERRPESTGDAT